MSLPVLEFTIVPDSISVYNESSGMYIYQVFGVFENEPDFIGPIAPAKAIASNKTNRFGEVREFNCKHTRSSHFTLALDEYGDDDFTKGSIQSMYVSVILSDWYYQRCKKFKTMTVQIFNAETKQFIGIFNFKGFKHHMVKINTNRTIEHAITGTISNRNYDKAFTTLINTFSDIIDDEGQLKVYIWFR